MRSLLAHRLLWKALLVTLLLSSGLPAEVQAQTQTQTKAKKKKSKAKGQVKPPAKAAQEQAKAQEEAKAAEQTQAPEEAKAAEQVKAAAQAKAQEEAKAAEQAKAQEEAKARAQEQAKARKPAKTKGPAKAPEQPKVVQEQPKPKEPEATPRPVLARVPPKMLIGLGLNLFTEDSQMTGAQSVNSVRRSESFNYSSGFLSAMLAASIPAPLARDRARVGGGIRVFGNYGARGDSQFGFGLLNQLFVTGEYGLPVADRMEALFGARGGVSILVPGSQLQEEIDRLRAQGVDVWGVPRVGWLAGLSVGARRRMSEHILLRADVSGQLDQLYLFATSQQVNGLYFDKDWTTFGLSLGFTLGVEFAIF